MRTDATLQASCPARLDIGNSLDYPSHFFSLPNKTANTTNIAIELRTTVIWEPSKSGRIWFRSDSIQETHRGLPDPARSQFPLLCSLLRHFQVQSGVFTIRSNVPIGSGLGGSAMLVIALLALIRRRELGAISRRHWPAMLLLAHLFENWLGFSNTGFHDQLAALYGGANLWTWGSHFTQPMPVFERTPVKPQGGNQELGRHLLLGFTGQMHRKVVAGRQHGPLPHAELKWWSKVSEHAANFAQAVKESDWQSAAGHLNAECDLRVKLRPGCLSWRARRLIDEGREVGAGCRYAGHGHGGCVWACGDTSTLAATRHRWEQTVRPWRGAWVIQPEVAARGLLLNS